ncbi:MAG: hypothetical protein GY786_07070 [Proteobacteria bacterium]|nr:hypothetical protein [Pseudomonadota bacterium]
MVNSLKSEFEDDIKFVIADLTKDDGSAFGQAHDAGKITLILFRPDGSKITTLAGLRSENFYRRAFKRAFKLN